MGKMLIALDDEVESQFRETVKRVMGSRKGGLSIACQQAIRAWIEKQG